MKKNLRLLFIAFLILMILSGCVRYSNGKPVETEKSKVEQNEGKSKEKKAEVEAKKKEDEAAAKKKAEEETPAKKEKIKADYIKNVKPTVDNIIKTYDQIWNTYWNPTFFAMAQGNYDPYKSYGDLIYAGKQYKNLMSVSITPVKEMSKEDKKNLNDFEMNMSTAAMIRMDAIKLAANMIDKNEFAPSTINKIKDTVNQADTQMVSALASLMKVESKYGIKR